MGKENVGLFSESDDGTRIGVEALENVGLFSESEGGIGGGSFRERWMMLLLLMLVMIIWC